MTRHEKGTARIEANKVYFITSGKTIYVETLVWQWVGRRWRDARSGLATTGRFRENFQSDLTPALLVYQMMASFSVYLFRVI